MACGFTDISGCVAEAADAAATGAVEALAKAIQEAIGKVLASTIVWWTRVDAINLGNEQTVIDRVRGLLLPIAVAVAVGGVIWQGIRMMLTRKPDPLITIVKGFFTVAVWTAIGVTLPNMLLRAGDAFSTWALDESTGGKFAERMTTALGFEQLGARGLVIIIGILVLIATVVQAVLMVFREMSVLILTGTIVLAATGAFTHATSVWLRKVLGWMLALICYKPMAAMIYAMGFLLIGEGNDVKAMFMGFATLALSLVALPVLMKFFTWMVDSAGGDGGGLLAAAASGTAAANMIGGVGGGSSASDHASFISKSLPGPASDGGADRRGRGDPSGAASDSRSQPNPAPTTGLGATEAPTPTTNAAPAAAGASGTTTAGGAGAAAGTAGTAAAGAATGGVVIAVQAGVKAGAAGVQSAANAADKATRGE